MRDLLTNLLPATVTPKIRLLIDGQELGPNSQQRLLGLTLVDKRGFAADHLTLELSDHDGQLALPNLGQELQLWLGYEETGLVFKGRYTVSEHGHSGAPDTISLTAHSADLAASLAEQTDHSWHQTNVHAIATALANKHGYTPAVADVYQQEAIAHLDQTSESDASFLTRLAQQVGATTSVKNGHLLFMPIGLGKTASGLYLPMAVITRQDGDSHSYQHSHTDAYQAVRAYYTEPGTGKKKAVLIHQDDNDSQQTPSDTAHIKTLRHPYKTKADAERAAQAELGNLKRTLATFSITLAQGRPDLLPEMPVQVSGFKDVIDAQKWLVDEVSHQVSDGGYVCGVKLERVEEKLLETNIND